MKDTPRALNIEARAMIDMASKHIIPAVMRFSRNLAGTVNEIKTGRSRCDCSDESCSKIQPSPSFCRPKLALAKLQEVSRLGGSRNGRTEENRQSIIMKLCCNSIWKNCEFRWIQLEMMVDKEEWPMPSYGDLLFEV